MTTPAKFVWYELMTNDPASATQFYKTVVGWTASRMGDYTILATPHGPAAGLMKWVADAKDIGVPARWIGYIGVDDVDSMVTKLVEAGGTLHKAAEEIPDVGRFAVVADPQGGAFVLFTPLPRETPADPPPGTIGRIGWHELHAAHWQDAFEFYEKLFGWTKAEAIDMGPMGTYQLFATGGIPNGGMMNRKPGTPRPFWSYYFTVDNIKAAAARVTEAGGKVLMGPQEVPGGAWILQARDPQGGAFALTARA